MAKLRRSTKQYLVIVSLSFLILGAAFATAYFILLGGIEKKYEIQLNQLSNELEANRNYVYEAISDIEAGACITADLVEHKEVYSSQDKSTFISEEDFGKVALISIPAGVYVQKSMLQSEWIEDQVREVAFNCIEMADQININDTVDVRVFFPNGENYIVLSKKVVKNCFEDRSQCYLWIEEEEILRISSAIVDAYLYQGAYLYCTKYVEPTVQEASVVNYQPSLATQKLIKENPNIIKEAQTVLSQQLRKELENRLADSLKTEVGQIQWEVSNKSNENAQPEDTLGPEQVTADHFYYLEEEKAKEEDVEYGE